VFSTDAERVARSSSENTFTLIEATGRWIEAGLCAGNQDNGGIGLQIDNTRWNDCRTSGGWFPGSSTARTHWKNGLNLGDGNSGNCVIHKVNGGSYLLCQSGINVNNTDAWIAGAVMQSNGVPSDDTTGDITINGVTHYFHVDGVRSELSARFIGFATASTGANAHGHVSNVDFAINGGHIFSTVGNVIIWNLPGTFILENFRASGDDPIGYTPSRGVTFQFNNTRGLTVFAAGIHMVGVTIEQAFASGFSYTAHVHGYHKLNTDNTIATTWEAPVTITGSVAPQAHVDQKNWWTVGGTAPDTNLYRGAANLLKTDDKFAAVAGLGVGNSAAATTLGSVTKKIEVFDASGVSLGFVPVYNSIT
jgi:hypothetical protein